jgi:hypothetical protein
MTLALDLPPPLDAELRREAEREGVSPNDHATLLLYLATALLSDDPETPFQKAVHETLRSQSFGADRAAPAFEGLTRLCASIQDAGKASPTLQKWLADSGQSSLPSAVEAKEILRLWRNQAVHRPLEQSLELTVRDLPPLQELVQRSGRRSRSSALGKFAHLSRGSEEYAAEKQEAIAHEERSPR